MSRFIAARGDFKDINVNVELVVERGVLRARLRFAMTPAEGGARAGCISDVNVDDILQRTRGQIEAKKIPVDVSTAKTPGEEYP